ncbi:Bifunctional protein Aas [Pseudobythopirellula maris]|uniref:Bifunctional protein Aas n=1 Tax=Pseudobythopirellula maris TaxID=2527991 RepID=A0A5C5ZT34_9BACT|nr:AMP-binding protein [Pseudobythopirellula maris]TWT90704.1 Bifunctional protein Aas [Pseudobythopirellula maris]
MTQTDYHLPALSPPRAMLRACKRAIFRWKTVDTAGAKLTGGQLLMRSLVVRRMLARELLGADEKQIGVLLPPSNGAVVVNAALALDRRVAVNLNYSVTEAVMNACVRKAGIRHVLTSRKVVDKLDMKIDAEVVCLEDLRDKATLADKALGALGAYATPSALLERRLGLHTTSMDDLLTVIFTSGSTGEPKGVMLTHANIASNIDAMHRGIDLSKEDVILGILPFFHSFGYTVTLWTPLALDLSAVYHFSPLDARQIGKLSREHGATILLSTPTFLRSYMKRCNPEDFASLEVVVVGAEKLPISLSDSFEKKFGVRPVEGYGATELSPLVSVNVPACRSHTEGVDSREGSVGQPVCGVRARVVDPESREPLAQGEEGMLEITGPNLMLGYFDDAEKTAAVVHDGWYVTGDISVIDPEGFIHITGRLSRFSKIGGEMVPHVRVEEEIQRFLGDEEAEAVSAVVTAVPDARKGERLIVVHKAIDKSPDEIAAHLKAVGVPNLWIPGNDSYLLVDELPLLGSGKLDLKRLAEVAREHFAAGA